MGLSCKEAGDKVGKSKQAIQQAIKGGKITAEKNEHGEWEIDPAELFRVYPLVKQVADKNLPQLDDTLHVTLQGEIKDLRHELELTRKDLEHEKSRAKAAEESRDNFSEKLDKLLDNQKLLAAPKEEADKGKNFSGTPVPGTSPNRISVQSVAAEAAIIFVGVGLYFGYNVVVANLEVVPRFPRERWKISKRKRRNLR